MTRFSSLCGVRSSFRVRPHPRCPKADLLMPDELKPRMRPYVMPAVVKV